MAQMKVRKQENFGVEVLCGSMVEAKGGYCVEVTLWEAFYSIGNEWP